MSWGGMEGIIKKKQTKKLGKRESPSNIPVFEYQTSFSSFFDHSKKPQLNSPFLAATDPILDLFSAFAKAS